MHNPKVLKSTVFSTILISSLWLCPSCFDTNPQQRPIAKFQDKMPALESISKTSSRRYDPIIKKSSLDKSNLKRLLKKENIIIFSDQHSYPSQLSALTDYCDALKDAGIKEFIFADLDVYFQPIFDSLDTSASSINTLKMALKSLNTIDDGKSLLELILTLDRSDIRLSSGPLDHTQQIDASKNGISHYIHTLDSALSSRLEPTDHRVAVLIGHHHLLDLQSRHTRIRLAQSGELAPFLFDDPVDRFSAWDEIDHSIYTKLESLSYDDTGHILGIIDDSSKSRPYDAIILNKNPE